MHSKPSDFWRSRFYPGRPGHRVNRRIRRHVAVLTTTCLLAAADPVWPYSLPDFEEVRASFQPSDLVVLDRHGEAVAAVRVDYAERRGRWVALSDVSAAMRQAVLLSEDRRFHEHGGVDWRAVAAAGWDWIWGGARRGASTVSMQLVAMLDTSLQRPAGGRSLNQKLSQARRAWQLEATWTKTQILEAYLNLAAFRGELRGIDSASRVMFGKHPHGLDRRESAVAAALLRGPNAEPGRVVHRACAILQESVGQQACSGLEPYVHQWLHATSRPAVDQPSLAPHFSRVVAAKLKRHSGGELLTTLDAPLQREAVSSVRRHLAGMGNTRLTDAAVVVLDNHSGEVLAYVGSSGSVSAAGEVDHVRALRQAGSTLKPFLYALALEARHLTAASLLNDAALDVETASGLYVPRNYDLAHAGLVSVRRALAASLNIPAVRTLMMVGPAPFADRLRRLGLPLVHDGDHYGYSLSLGSADVDLLSLTNAYRVLAQGGYYSEPRVVTGEGEAMQPPLLVIDPLASWVVGDILSDREARAPTFGLESALSTRFWSAVKTGTSKDMRDNWSIGWSARHTVGVWVGNSGGLSMRDVSGVTAAAPIWHELMSYLHARQPSHRPPPPASLEHRHITFADDLEAPRAEFFLPGTALARVEPLPPSASGKSRITRPIANTVIALDPDLPIENQRLALRAAPAALGRQPLQWRIGATVVAQGASAYWLPRVGRHRIVLQDAAGVVMDEVQIQVRGLPHMRPPGINGN